ncbi:MAG: hypothetical protein M1826_002530 [Phylliscum demangeonii]|nr:MAG: hypothetical protein M1826_002530 [Phylliscum demangeonii]
MLCHGPRLAGHGRHQDQAHAIDEELAVRLDGKPAIEFSRRYVLQRPKVLQARVRPDDVQRPHEVLVRAREQRRYRRRLRQRVRVEWCARSISATTASAPDRLLLLDELLDEQSFTMMLAPSDARCGAPGPPFAQPRAPSEPRSTTTRPYFPPEAGVEDTFRPFALCLSPSLPDRMLEDLPNLLQQQPHVDHPVSMRLEVLWEEALLTAARWRISHESVVGNVWTVILRFCYSFYYELCATELNEPVESLNGEVKVRMDIGLEVGDEARLAIEVKRDLVYTHHQHDLDSLIGQAWLGWNGTDHVTGAKSIILKLALWMGAKIVRWGIIGTERQYRIIRRQHAMINNQPYPYLEISDTISIDSGAPALVSLLFYILLTGVDARQDRFPIPERLEIPTKDPHLSTALQKTRQQTLKDKTSSTPSLGRIPGNARDPRRAMQLTVSFVELARSGRRVISLERVQPSAHDLTSWEGVGFDDEGSPAMSPTPSLTLSMTSSDASDGQEDAAILTIMVHSRLGYGAVGQCYKGAMGATTVVLKFALPGQEQALEQEAFLYEHFLSTAAASKRCPIAPKFYGYFSSDDYRNIVVSFTGEALESFDQLTLDAKTRLFGQVQTLHALGIVHGDLAPWNITLDEDGTTTIIDFSHSYLHDCETTKKQDGYCDELQSFASHLGLAESSFLTKTAAGLE